MKTFRIGMIGVGDAGEPLLRQLLGAPFVEVVAVADLNLEGPGAQLARERGVKLTPIGLDVAELGAGVDIIIDMTGSAKVREDLRRYMQFSGNTHTVIVHERVALLMLSLCAGEYIESTHPNMKY